MIFKQNKYTKWYYDIVNNAKLLGRKKGGEMYYERHHVIPRKLGGGNVKDNLVLLTAREHYICHLLLVRMVEEPSHKKAMEFALVVMNKGIERFKSSYLYEGHRKSISQKVSERNREKVGELNPFYGKSHTVERKILIGEQHRGANNHFFGKKRPDHSEFMKSIGFGKNKTKEHEMKLSIIQKEKAKTNPIRAQFWEVRIDEKLICIKNLKKWCRERNIPYLKFYQGNMINGIQLIGKKKDQYANS